VRLVLLLLLSSAAALALASCGTQPVEIPKEVKVPVPTACIDPAKRPAPPHLRSSADLLAMDRGTRTLAAWSDRLKMEIYIAELEAIADGCSRIPVSK
jgi:hypothetical protein